MEENVEPVVLKTYATEIDAELAVQHLQAHGIRASLVLADPATVGVIRGARVLVRKDEVEEAAEVLRAMNC